MQGCSACQETVRLRAVYSGATKKEGHTVYSGLSESDSAGDGSWGTWTTGLVPPDAPGTPEPWSDLGLAPWQFLIQDQVLKFFVFGDPAYNSLSFNLNSDDLAKTHKVMNRGGAEGANPDLSFFQNRGGKLIIYSGWSDPAVSPEETIRYYNSVVQQQGGLDRTQRFARLFMAPGMQHCIGSGPGPNVFNPLTSLIDWVEKNVAPKNITAAHFHAVPLSRKSRVQGWRRKRSLQLELSSHGAVRLGGRSRECTRCVIACFSFELAQ
ncbi:MAG: hypothetical protein DMG84_23180 [Acidobacteria bacterium]|nr:MAG: hypothetical protein DMG84_23180 [Acidobacteriota bacterium]